jgi:hypothetical protein
MGKIRDYSKIRFKPFEIRKGNIKATNYYSDGDKKLPLQTHLKLPKFSFFEIVYVEKNPYFGNEANYVESWGGMFYENPETRVSLDKSLFKYPETCYMLAHWEKMNHDEFIPELVFCGDRPLRLSPIEQMNFMDIALATQEYITDKLEKFGTAHQW